MRQRRVVPARLLALFVVPVLSLGAIVPTVAAQEGAPTPTDHEVVSHDGTVLAATLYRADAGVDDPRPIILTTHGWASDRSSRADDARWLNGLGYHVLAYDSRGFGASGGQVGMNGPNEVADVTTLIDWWLDHANASSAYSILLDGPRDPRLGMTGVSYAGAIQLLASAADPRIDVLVPDITWHDLRESLAPGGVVKRGWVDFLFWGGTLSAAGLTTGDPGATGGLDPSLRDWYLQAMSTGRLPDAAREPLAERSPRTVLGDVDADVLLLQAWADTLFDPDEAAATYAALAGRSDAATRLILHDGGHTRTMPSDTTTRLRDEVGAFLRTHLARVAADTPAVPVLVLDGANRAWHTTDPWDRPAPVPTALRHPGGAPQVTLLQTATPGSHTEAQAVSPTQRTGHADTALPTHTYLETGIEGPVILLGRPQLRLNVTSDLADLTLFASLVAGPPDGPRTVVHDQVTPIRLSPATGNGQIDVPLVSTLHALPAGHTLTVRLTTSDTAYHGAREAGTVTLLLDQATLSVPTLPYANVTPAPTPVPEPTVSSANTPAAGTAVLLLLVTLAAAAVRRAHPRN